MVAIEIDSGGLRRVIVYADNSAQQQEAHLLLARCAPALAQLDKSLKVPVAKKE